MKQAIALVAYTTRYRDGCAEIARVARTLRDELVRDDGMTVWLVPLVTKRDFTDVLADVHARGLTIAALHFVGHSGMYGPMFGSTAYAEQLSPHEWRTLHIPFAEGASAYFHACRTARWFTPFFARTFRVPTYGHHGYTTFSREKERFAWEGPVPDEGAPLYAISCPGKKTHGLVASARKYTVGTVASPMLRAEPEERDARGSYDAVAHLYDEAFSDITQRRAEWAYVSRHVDEAFRYGKPRVLDIGAGNGALLDALAPRIARSLGVDASLRMVEHARARCRHEHVQFAHVRGPEIPAEDGSFDIVVSFLSFRYLDWDPILAEIHRVLVPGGRLVLVDMVEKPLELRDAVVLARSAFEHVARPLRAPRFDAALRALTSHPDWAVMLRENPIRAEHEYRFYLESRFPGRELETLTVTRTQRLVAFDSGPVYAKAAPPMSYP